MTRLKSTLVISLLTFPLLSCAPKTLDINEASVVINSIEEKLNDSEFDFPTKITINKLVKKSNSYVDKLIIRFSLDDNYIYYSNGFEESTLHEQWKYVDKEEGKIFHLTSITENNKSRGTYYVTTYNEENNFFKTNYDILKNLVISECNTFKETLDTFKHLNKVENVSSNLKISSTSEKNIELDASFSDKSEKVNATQSFENYLPKITNIYRMSENKEEKNYETKYYYNGVNITRPNLHNFVLKK